MTAPPHYFASSLTHIKCKLASVTQWATLPVTSHVFRGVRFCCLATVLNSRYLTCIAIKVAPELGDKQFYDFFDLH